MHQPAERVFRREIEGERGALLVDLAKRRRRPDQNLQLLALQTFYEYWFVDGHNAVSGGGVKMIEPAFCSVWNWDARPFPAFPNLVNVWGDAGNWRAGNW